MFKYGKTFSQAGLAAEDPALPRWRRGQRIEESYFRLYKMLPLGHFCLHRFFYIGVHIFREKSFFFVNAPLTTLGGPIIKIPVCFSNWGLVFNTHTKKIELQVNHALILKDKINTEQMQSYVLSEPNRT